MLKEIKSDMAPKAIGPYSQAVESGNLVFLSGQIGIDPTTGRLVEGGIREQTEQVLKNIEAVLKEATLSFKNVTRAEVYLRDLNDFKLVNELYAGRFSSNVKPARQTMQVARLPMDALIEISCMATRG